jgi:hypothetical protein
VQASHGAGAVLPAGRRCAPLSSDRAEMLTLVLLPLPLCLGFPALRSVRAKSPVQTVLLRARPSAQALIPRAR